VYYFAFGGITKVMELYNVIIRINLANPHAYILRYQSGPWYQYFIDFFLLSPHVSLCFFLYWGHYILGNSKRNEQLNLILIFFVYSVFIFSFLPKNIRYVEALDMIYRFSVIFCIIGIGDTFKTSLRIKNMIMAFILLLFVAIDLKTSYKYNFELDIYDPVSFNLLRAQNVFIGVSESPLADYYLNNSYYYFKKGKYLKCIESAQNAIAVKPNCASAYINICCAYNELKEWDLAIAAGKKAVEMDPNNHLAKNNLNWAISHKQRD
jgi:tetratricopeptide (TPR) repeat protein